MEMVEQGAAMLKNHFIVLGLASTLPTLADACPEPTAVSEGRIDRFETLRRLKLRYPGSPFKIKSGNCGSSRPANDCNRFLIMGANGSATRLGFLNETLSATQRIGMVVVLLSVFIGQYALTSKTASKKLTMAALLPTHRRDATAQGHKGQHVDT